MSCVKSDLAGWKLGRCVWVVDRGFSSEENLRCLRRGGGSWIAGMRMRSGEAACEAALAHPGRYRQIRDNLRVKEVRLGEGDAERRFIVCHNPEQEARDRTRRERAVERIEAELERIEALRARAGKTGTAHERAECALRDHPTYSRYLRQTPSGRLRLDKAKLAAEAKLEGKYLLETCDPELSAEDAALGYKNLQRNLRRTSVRCRGTATCGWIDISDLETTLSLALEKTKAKSLKWKQAAKTTRFVVELDKWRLRIESVSENGKPPFKFSIMQPGSGKGEIDAVRSVEANHPLSADETRVNQALQELWELASASPGDLGDLNQLLDSIK